MQDWLVGIVAFIFGLIVFNPQGFFGFVAVCVFTFAVVSIYQIVYHSSWLERWHSEQERARQQAKSDAENAAIREQVRQEWLASGFHLPTPQDFYASVNAKPAGIAFAKPKPPDHYQAFYDVYSQRTWYEASEQFRLNWQPYLTDTAFSLPDAQRFAGTWIVAPPGRGKTNLLHNLIAEDRKHGTVVLMDSKGDLINAYRNEAIVIEPATANINPLQLGSSTRTVEFLEYIFSALLDTSMTPLQKTLFRSILSLLLVIPNATLETFRVILTNGYKTYAAYAAQCDPATADFFLKGEFDSKTYSETKTQILWRLRLILSNEYLRAIFTAPETNVPFNELLDSKKLIIIDNSTDMLGEEGAEFFGRFFVALIWMTAVGRSRLRPEDKVPVFFYIDECQTVVWRDTKIATILDTCRSQKIALVLAHQRIGQIEANVIDALNNCAIRLANSDDDAEALAKRFRVDASALRLPVGQFSCFVRDLTPTAVTINVPLFETTYVPPPKASVIAPQRTTEAPIPTDEVEDF